MSTIREVFDRLNDVEASIALFDRVDEVTFADKMAIRSLENRRDELLELANELSESQLVDVCDYRIIPDFEGNYPVKSVGDALSAFQTTFTAFFAAIRENRPRVRAQYPADIVQSSTLNLGYSYAGSLGLVLYSLSDRLVTAEGDQDKAIDAMIEVVEDSSPESIKHVADQFGKAAINSFYQWSKVHVENGFSVDLKWKRGAEVKKAHLIQPTELRAVIDVIDKAVMSDEKAVELAGILVALDVTRRTFKISFPDAADIHGAFAEGFDANAPHEVPGRYTAKLLKRTVSRLLDEEPEVIWKLVDLVEIK